MDVLRTIERVSTDGDDRPFEDVVVADSGEIDEKSKMQSLQQTQLKEESEKPKIIDDEFVLGENKKKETQGETMTKATKATTKEKSETKKIANEEEINIDDLEAPSTGAATDALPSEEKKNG